MMGIQLRSILATGCLAVFGLISAGCAPTGTATLPVAQTALSTSELTQSLPAASPTQTATSIPPTETSTPTITPTQPPTFTPTITPLPEQLTDEFGVPMVLIPAGSFLMGTQVRAGNERPEHTVWLDDYYIDQYEATNASFAEFLNVKGNQMEGLAPWIEEIDPDLRIHQVEGVWQVDAGYENYPMNEVTWYGARAYCEWRGARLPSEAEWEKAARGTDGRTFPWGEEIDCSKANYAGCFYAAVPVDSFPEWTSPYGVYNMAGNIMEWTNDWYAPDYYANSPETNPTGPETGDFKVFRGGSYNHGAGNVRTTYRYPKLPVLTYVSTGFRCARSISP